MTCGFDVFESFIRATSWLSHINPYENIPPTIQPGSTAADMTAFCCVLAYLFIAFLFLSVKSFSLMATSHFFH